MMLVEDDPRLGGKKQPTRLKIFHMLDLNTGRSGNSNGASSRSFDMVSKLERTGVGRQLQRKGMNLMKMRCNRGVW
ncbi:hypothetical protein EUTSA_v10021869mg [Eutrema salsugineum]|uniref:Uncharacterized protein n=1 Tax=Eutrema salsugineum TaxID=72664 RepID=V4LYF6_EUTSA|nr:hypothetical protein EUTSA_v10021869mg [Eutrema salsugineum]